MNKVIGMKRPYNRTQALHILACTDLAGIGLAPGDVIRPGEDARLRYANGEWRCPAKPVMPLSADAAELHA